MSKIEGSIENWENGALGLDEEHARAVSMEEVAAIEKAAGMQLISIRLERDLIGMLKLIAKYHGIGYQPMVRDLLWRFANAEAKDLYAKLRDQAEQREKDAGEPMTPVGDFMRRTA